MAMKKVFQHFTSVFLALAILMVSGGFTLSKMTCLKSGYETVALSKQGECCNNEISSHASIKSKCCAIFNQDLQVGHFFSSLNKVDLKQHPITFTVFSHDAFAISSNPISAINFNKIIHPPPLEGIDLLHFIHKLTV